MNIYNDIASKHGTFTNKFSIKEKLNYKHNKLKQDIDLQLLATQCVSKIPFH